MVLFRYWRLEGRTSWPKVGWVFLPLKEDKANPSGMGGYALGDRSSAVTSTTGLTMTKGGFLGETIRPYLGKVA